ncbi:MAG TPA: monovalent cation/H(+) antiporter subunit G [Verrucomicrobiota bacterium]|nr:monovalent cation/H(+) antiporter subunit G [Verrucomicrobiota bacterium]
MNELFTVLLLLTGAFLILTAAIGVVRLPDVLCRSHAVAKALTLGMFLMLLGLWVHLDDSSAALKITLAIFFQLVTIPVASHLVGLLALQKKLPRWKERPMDDHRKTEPP